jgi:hypothetical protein
MNQKVSNKYSALVWYLLVSLLSIYFLWRNIQTRGPSFEFGLTIKILWAVFVLIFLILLFFPKTLSFLKIPPTSFGFKALLFGLLTSFVGVISQLFFIFSVNPASDATIFPPMTTFILAIIVGSLLSQYGIKRLEKSSVLIFFVIYLISVFYIHFVFFSDIVTNVLGDMTSGFR